MAIAIADGFDYKGAKPLDARIKYATTAEMKSAADGNLYDGCMAYCVATDKYYKWLSSNTVDETLGKWREFSSGGSSYTAGDGIVIDNDEISTDNLQEGDMADITYPIPAPQPLVTSLGGLSDVAIISPTNKQALIYNSDTKVWENGEGGGGSYTAGDGINIDENYEISTDNLQEGDLEDVISTLPGLSSKHHRFSTSEQIVGEWITGEQIYEKTYVINNPTDAMVIDTNISTIIGCTNLVWISNPGHQTWSNCGWFAANDNYTFRFQITNNSSDLKLRVTNNTTLTITRLYATLTYTKTS